MTTTVLLCTESRFSRLNEGGNQGYSTKTIAALARSDMGTEPG